MKLEIKNIHGMACLALVMVMSIFLIIALDLYRRDKNTFLLQVKDAINKSIEKLNIESLKNPRGFISSGKDYNDIVIIRGPEKFVYKCDYRNDYNYYSMRAIYDICDNTYWSLEKLVQIFRSKVGDQEFPFIFTRLDSVNQIIDSYESGYILDEESFKEQYVVELGLIEGHKLVTCFAYDVSYFWSIEKQKLLVIFFFLVLISICIVLFVRLIQSSRQRLEEHELLVEALNHDMKSPLAELQMRLYQIREASVENFSEEQERLYAVSMKKYNEMQNSIDLLLAASLDARGLSLKPELLDLPTLAQKQIDDMLAFVPEGKQVMMTTSFDVGEARVMGDEHHLSRVIANLLRNAMKYSSDEVNITVVCRREGDYVSVLVEDDGFGIKKKDLKRIFSKNYRADWYIGKRKVDGFGLGLSYAKMIVKAHHGSIRAVSEPEKGSIFIVDLPVYKPGRKKHNPKDTESR